MPSVLVLKIIIHSALVLNAIMLCCGTLGSTPKVKKQSAIRSDVIDIKSRSTKQTWMMAAFPMFRPSLPPAFTSAAFWSQCKKKLFLHLQQQNIEALLPIEHLSHIDCLIAHTTCLVCFISTVNGRSKKRSLGRWVLVVGTQQTLSNLFWRLLISMLLSSK